MKVFRIETSKFRLWDLHSTELSWERLNLTGYIYVFVLALKGKLTYFGADSAGVKSRHLCVNFLSMLFFM